MMRPLNPKDETIFLDDDDTETTKLLSDGDDVEYKPNGVGNYGMYNDEYHDAPDEVHHGVRNGGLHTVPNKDGMYTKDGRLYRRALSFADSIDRITLTWHHIHVYAPLKGGGCCKIGKSKETTYKRILNEVSGIVQPGTLLAIMGASGAGKTSLLNVLTYRNRGNLVVNGEVKVNGQRIGQGMTSVSGYVQQDDLFVPTLTVREHLWFQAMLRMDTDIPYDVRIDRINGVIKELGLTKCADTLIGKPGEKKGISGGEMKRLSFASEVLTNPPLLFCDEPTSGLDSFMAENVIQTLKGMASKGKTVICTIHQPSSEVYALFDRVMLMAEGRVAYLGPADQCLEFFSRQGFECPVNYNPADYFIHNLAIVPGKETQCRQLVQKISDTFDASSLKSDVTAAIDSVASEIGDSKLQEAEAYSDRSRYKAGVVRQFTTLFWRSWVSYYRDRQVFYARLIQQLVITVIIGLTFGKIDVNIPGGILTMNGALFFMINEVTWSNQFIVLNFMATLGGCLFLQQKIDDMGVQNINGAMFWILTNSTFSNMYNVLRAFPTEMPLYFREYGNGMYRPIIYYLCKTMAELPVFIFYPTMFLTIFYWMVGLYPAASEYFVALGTVILVANCGCSFGYMLSTCTSNINIAMTIAPPLTIPLMLFGGFFLNAGSIPVWLEWLKYLSWFNFANEILVVNQWENIDNITCTLPPLSDPTATPPGCYDNGAQVINQMRFSVDNFNMDFGILLALLIGYRTISLMGLLIRTKLHK